MVGQPSRILRCGLVDYERVTNCGIGLGPHFSIRTSRRIIKVRRRSSYANITNLAFTRRGIWVRSRHSLQVSYFAVSEGRHGFERWHADAGRRVCSIRGSMVLHFRDRLHSNLTDLVGCPSHKQKDMSSQSPNKSLDSTGFCAWVLPLGFSVLMISPPVSRR